MILEADAYSTVVDGMKLTKEGRQRDWRHWEFC